MTVYKQYSQQQLDEQYNNRLHVPGYSDYFTRWEFLSNQVRQKYIFSANIPYGNHPRECLDIFTTGKPQSRILIFIHGGYWHLLDKSLFHFIAPAFLEQNISLAFINYPLAPGAGMDEISFSCRKAMHWLYNNSSRFNIDSSQIFVLGYSAGGHLAAMLLADKELYFLKGIISLSGLFNLEPIMLSGLNSILLMDKETACRNSPVFLKPANECAVLLAVGSNETNEFKDQTAELYNSWKDKLINIQFLTVADTNHYSIIDAAAEQGSVLHSAITKFFHLQNTVT